MSTSPIVSPRILHARIALLLAVCAGAVLALASSANAGFVPDERYRYWNRDLNLNRVEDTLEVMPASGVVDVIVLANTCHVSSLKSFLSSYGTIAFEGHVVYCFLVEGVTVADARTAIANHADVFRVELAPVMTCALVNSAVIIRARGSSSTIPAGCGQSAAALGFTGAGQTVVIMDSGIDDGHPSLTGKVIAGYDATNPTDPADGSTDPDDTFGHGTHIAGIVAGAGSASPDDFVGIAPGAELIDVKVGEGRDFGNAAILDGMQWVVENAATWSIDVVNLSFQEHNVDNGSGAWAIWADEIVRNGIVVVAAAGNDGTAAWYRTGLPQPGSAGLAITVGSIDDDNSCQLNDDDISDFSQWGPRDPNPGQPRVAELKPDVVAPGDGPTSDFDLCDASDDEIFSCQHDADGQSPGDDYCSWSGTSMAAPHVAGVAALILEACQGIAPERVKEVIRETADQYAFVLPDLGEDVWDNHYGMGLVNAFEAANNIVVGLETDLEIHRWQGDIYLDNPHAVVSVDNGINARVFNRGSNLANDVRVLFYTNRDNIGNPTRGPGGWNYIGEDVRNVPTGPTPTIFHIDWTPQFVNHQCLQARIDYCIDPNTENNLGQDNLHVEPFSSEIEFELVISHSYSETKSVDIVIDKAEMIPGYEVVAFSPDGLFPDFSDAVTFPVECNCAEPMGVRMTPGAGFFDGTYSRATLLGYVEGEFIGQMIVQGNVNTSAYLVHIDTASVFSGQTVELPMALYAQGVPMGGFDFLIRYDITALSFLGANPQAALADWEYITYRTGAESNCSSGCPDGLVRVVGIADLDNGPGVHPPPGAFEPHGTMAMLRFQVSADRNFIGQCVPVQFYWADCGDNTIASRTGDTTFVDDLIFAAPGGAQDLRWDEDDDIRFPESTRPDGLGAADSCLAGGGPEKPQPIRHIIFRDGWVCIDEPPDDRGDINLNGIANEVADAVLFSNYFIYGESVWDPTYKDAQILATDINDDGVVLTIADLVYLIRIITGDEQAFPPGEHPKSSSRELLASVDWRLDDGELVVDWKSDGDAGAVLLAFDHDGAEFGEPVLGENAAGMAMISHNDGTQLRMLIHGMEQGARIAAGDGVILRVPMVTSDPGLVLSEVEAADYWGNVMTVSLARPAHVPKSFALFQNVPNPFNATTRIDFNLPVAGDVTLIVYDVLGRKVATLVDDRLEAGAHHIEWEARDDSGRPLASGVYFYRIVTTGSQATRKMVLLK